MSQCPACDEPIPFKKIFLAINPIWIRCPLCSAKLVADRFIKQLGALALLLALAVAWPATIWLLRSDASPVWYAVAAIGLSAGIGYPMTLVALRRGRYLLRRSSEGPARTPDRA